MTRLESSHSFLIRGMKAFLRVEAGIDRGRAIEEEPDGFPLIGPTWAHLRSGIWWRPGR